MQWHDTKFFLGENTESRTERTEWPTACFDFLQNELERKTMSRSITPEWTGFFFIQGTRHDTPWYFFLATSAWYSRRSGNPHWQVWGLLRQGRIMENFNSQWPFHWFVKCSMGGVSRSQMLSHPCRTVTWCIDSSLMSHARRVRLSADLGFPAFFPSSVNKANPSDGTGNRSILGLMRTS